MSEKHRPKGNYAVMAERRDPTDALDFFPTPPWATRALMEHVLHPNAYDGCDVWEPACGEGHMAEVLAEYFEQVHATDVHDYGKGYSVGSFVGEGSDLARLRENPDWIITNPPFKLAIDFARRALLEARFGVALLLRTQWLESNERYSFFRRSPPTTVAIFSPRVAMVKGRWDPKASTATSYAWVVWQRPFRGPGSRAELDWIDPDSKQLLTRADDAARFASDASGGQQHDEQCALSDTAQLVSAEEN